MITDQFVVEKFRRDAKRAALIRRERSFVRAFIGCCLVGFGIGCLAGYIHYFL